MHGFCKKHPAEMIIANGECYRCTQENLARKSSGSEGKFRRWSKRLDRKLNRGHHGQKRCGVRKGT